MIYTSNILIPKVCPVRFAKVRDYDAYPFANYYTQKWHSSDIVHVQCQLIYIDYITTTSLRLSCYQLVNGEKSGAALFYEEFTYIGIPAASPEYHFFDITKALTGLSGFVQFEIVDDDTGEIYADSWPQEIGATTDTVLLTCWNSSNDFESYFGSFSYDAMFTSRIEGAFIPDGMTFANDIELLTDQIQRDTLIYSSPYEKETFTFGDGNGVPYWIGQMINAFFACDFVLIESDQYTAISELSGIWTPDHKANFTIELKPYNDGYRQGAETIFITDQDDAVINNENDLSFIL